MLDVAVERIGSNEVHQVVRVNHVVAEVQPVGIFREADRFAEIVERSEANVTAARDVDRGQIQRLAQQALLQGWRYEFVDLVGLLALHSQHNGASADVCEFGRIEECGFKRIAHDLAGQAPVGVHRVDGFAQLRVAKTECGLGIFKRHGGVVAGTCAGEFLDVWRDGARVLVNCRVLIFHFDGELGAREHLVLIPGDKAVLIGVIAGR